MSVIRADLRDSFQIGSSLVLKCLLQVISYFLQFLFFFAVWHIFKHFSAII